MPPKKSKPQIQKQAEQSGVIDVTTAARLIMVTPERLRVLVNDGYIKKIERGKYNLVEVVQGYIKFLKAEERRTSKVQTASKWQDARTAEVELRVAERKRELIPIDDALASMDFLAQVVRSEIKGLPARVTRDRDMKRKIDAEVSEALERTAKKLGQASLSLEQGIDIFTTKTTD